MEEKKYFRKTCPLSKDKKRCSEDCAWFCDGECIVVSFLKNNRSLAEERFA